MVFNGSYFPHHNIIWIHWYLSVEVYLLCFLLESCNAMKEIKPSFPSQQIVSLVKLLHYSTWNIIGINKNSRCLCCKDTHTIQHDTQIVTWSLHWGWHVLVYSRVFVPYLTRNRHGNNTDMTLTLKCLCFLARSPWDTSPNMKSISLQLSTANPALFVLRTR